MLPPSGALLASSSFSSSSMASSSAAAGVEVKVPKMEVSNSSRLLDFVTRCAFSLWYHNLPTPPPSSTISKSWEIAGVPLTPPPELNSFPTTLFPPPPSSSPYHSCPLAFIRFTQVTVHRTRLSASTLFLALLYLQRFIRLHPHIKPRPGSEIRVLSISLILANKFLNDHHFATKAWSQVTGIPLSDLVTMEREFLQALGWRLGVSVSEYAKWMQCLERFWKAQDPISFYGVPSNILGSSAVVGGVSQGGPPSAQGGVSQSGGGECMRKRTHGEDVRDYHKKMRRNLANTLQRVQTDTARLAIGNQHEQQCWIAGTGEVAVRDLFPGL